MSCYFHASTLPVFQDRSGDLDPPAFPASRKLTAQGKYKYNTKSKASWYWSRSYGASSRLGCQYYVLTDWQRWAFGVFDESREHGYVSPVWEFGAKEPSVMQALFYWARYVSPFCPAAAAAGGCGERMMISTSGLAWDGSEQYNRRGSGIDSEQRAPEDEGGAGTRLTIQVGHRRREWLQDPLSRLFERVQDRYFPRQPGSAGQHERNQVEAAS